nr:hypothetical protein [candidate division Zixibacteria bacterium]
MAFASGRDSVILHVFILTAVFFLSTCLQVVHASYKPTLIISGNSVTFHWTAPGDDMNKGQAYLYDIRISTNPVGNDIDSWWNRADTVCCEPRPEPAGTHESFTISGLDSGQVYLIALKTADEVMNWSAISNIYYTSFSSCADINDDSVVNVLDIVYLTRYLYLSGPSPVIFENADINNDGHLNILDINYLAMYLYGNGPDPNCL